MFLAVAASALTWLSAIPVRRFRKRLHELKFSAVEIAEFISHRDRATFRIL
jgi:hypothetical protein